MAFVRLTQVYNDTDYDALFNLDKIIGFVRDKSANITNAGFVEGLNISIREDIPEILMRIHRAERKNVQDQK